MYHKGIPFAEHNASINVNPEGGGGGSGKGWGFDQSVCPVGRDFDWHFFLSGPRVGIFDRLTLISNEILKSRFLNKLKTGH